MPKCASTWLQRHLFKERHGYRSVMSAKEAYFTLVWPIPFRFSDWREAREAIDWQGGDEVPVLSAEVLAGNPLTGGDNAETNMHRLHRVFPDAKILLIIREQRAMLRSIYKSLVNFGSTLSIKDHLYNDLPGDMPAFGPHYLQYHRLIAGYQHTFGSDSVLVLPMELFQENPQEFLSRINAYSGVDSERYPLPPGLNARVNVNQTLVNIELKRLFNRFIARTRLNYSGVYTPKLVGGAAQTRVAVPGFVDRYLEKRFADTVEFMTSSTFNDSNDITQQLTGLDLAQYGYKLSASGGAQ